MVQNQMAAYKKVLNINPQNAAAYYNVAIAYYNRQEFALARKYCQKAVDLGYVANPKFLQLLSAYR